VREVLGAKYDMGLFKDPYVRIGKAETDLPTLRRQPPAPRRRP
jgi:hypothetical protein